MCEHPIQLLVGVAEGIKCRGCGMIFKDFDELHKGAAPAAAPEVKEDPKPKKEKKGK